MAQKSNINQTWISFKVHFKAAGDECKRKVTAKSGNCHGANLASNANLEARLIANIHAKYAAATLAAQPPAYPTPRGGRNPNCHISANWSYTVACTTCTAMPRTTAQLASGNGMATKPQHVNAQE
jgi:hypothetical protein